MARSVSHLISRPLSAFDISFDAAALVSYVDCICILSLSFFQKLGLFVYIANAKAILDSPEILFLKFLS